MNTLTPEPQTPPAAPRTAPRLKTADRYGEAFRRASDASATPSPLWLRSARQAALDRFVELGWPTLRQEDWRFTNVEPIAQLPFLPVVAHPHEAPAPAFDPGPFATLEAIRLTFVDGHFCPSLSRLKGLPAGALVTHLAAGLSEHPALIEKHLGQLDPSSDNPFTFLNHAFFTDGAFIHLPAGVDISMPICLIFVTSTREPGTAIHTRNIIQAGARSRLTVLENHLHVGDAPTVHNAVTQLIVGDDAVVEHCKFQDESPSAFHLAAINAQVGRASRLWAHSIVTGARLARNNIRLCLQGPGAEAILNGLYLTRGEQLADHHMIVDHASPSCASHEYFNGILSDRSRGVFHGRILVQPAAQKTDAKQTNKNLLLSDDATIDTKPQLEIYADDVKCTHGATVGQLNDESIFYLRARGLGLETARRMLVHAFAGEIVERIQCAAVREALDQLIWNRLEEHELAAHG